MVLHGKLNIEKLVSKTMERIDQQFPCISNKTEGKKLNVKCLPLSLHELRRKFLHVRRKRVADGMYREKKRNLPKG